MSENRETSLEMQCLPAENIELVSRRDGGVARDFNNYVAAKDSPRPDESPVSEVHSQSNGETILIAEDEVALQVLAKAILEQSGYKVILARDGVEAVSLYEKRSSEVDLLILDLIMPRLPGREAYDMIKRFGEPAPPVIYITGYDPEVLQFEPNKEAGEVLLRKPYSIDDLEGKVREALGAGRRGNGRQ